MTVMLTCATLLLAVTSAYTAELAGNRRIPLPTVDYSDEAMRYVFEPCWRIALRASFGQTADNEDEALAVMREKEQAYVTKVMELLVPLVSGQPWEYREAIYQSNLQACLNGAQRGMEKAQ